MLRYQNGKKVKASEYPGLEELCTICGMCNDSSVDYNEVRICSSNTNDNDNNFGTVWHWHEQYRDNHLKQICVHMAASDSWD